MSSKTLQNLLSMVHGLDLSAIFPRDHEDLQEELQRLSASGGKRIRAYLSALTTVLLKGKQEHFTLSATAVELTHLASLIHDDVIDQSDLRRGVPTLHSNYNHQLAILSGDYVLAHVIQMLCEQHQAALATQLSQCIKGLTLGEWLQHELRSSEHIRFDQLYQVAEYKTAGLFQWAMVSVAQLEKADNTTQNQLSRIARELGVCFQILDDVVDFGKHTGKPFCQDLASGQLNFVLLQLIETDPELFYPVSQLRGQKVTDENVPWTNHQMLAAIEGTIDRAREHMNRAREAWEILVDRHHPDEDLKTALSQIEDRIFAPAESVREQFQQSQAAFA